MHIRTPTERASWSDGSQGGFSRVRFNLSNIVVFEVTPYSEVYGLHPREFDFDADYALVPAQRIVAHPSTERHLETENEGPEENCPMILSLEALL